MTKKTIKIYPNNKDYITPEIRHCLKWKKQAFQDNNTTELRAVQKELKMKLKEAREQHSRRIREAFNNDSKQLWNPMKEARDLNSNKGSMYVLNEREKANELNNFYKQFDCVVSDGAEECQITSLTSCDPTDRIVIEPSAVAKVFKKNTH